MGQLTNEYQSHSGAVIVGTTPQVQYAYSVMAGGANHSRLTSMTYPNTSPVRKLTYNYNGTTLDDSISRLTSITDGATTLENYTYLGLDTVVKRGHPQPGIDLTYIKQSGEPNGDGGDQYTGLDRFGRVVDQRWIPTSSPQNPTDRFQYTYDQDSNRLTRTNAVNTNLNETYSYDNFNQLTNFTRGSHSQGWTLDPLGNWQTLVTDGDTTHPQTRTNNTQNQILTLTDLRQPTLVAPTYDNNGNTVTDQFGKTLIYDAWNRLVQYKSGSTVLASYAYDALGRRVIENPGAARDLYYSAAWQVLEEDSGGAMQDQYVWSPIYVDALVERDTPSQRLYVQQDANWSVTAVVDSTGAPKERYAYDPYGQPTFLDPATWATLASSAFAWLYLHQGGRRDSTSGLYNFRMRDYSPTLGQWTSEDPLRFGAGDSNLYRYLDSQPTGLSDPSGLLPQWTESSSDDGSVGNAPAPPPPSKNWFERCMDKYVGDPLFGWIADKVGPDNLSGPITDESIKEDLHTLLDLAGWVPVAGMPFTAADAIIYGAEGKPTDAAKAGIGIIPIGKFGKGGSKLVKALEKAGRPIAKGLERGHHIVAKAAARAEPARKKLKSLGINIDDAFNGIGLPKKFHEHLHTREYYERVNREAKKWKNKKDAIKGLTEIAEELLRLAQ